MEDERIAPDLVSVYKAEMWPHLGFCDNVHSGRLASPVWKAFAAGSSFNNNNNNNNIKIETSRF